MDTKPRIIIEVEPELMRRLKHWAIDNRVSIAAAGRVLFKALVDGDPDVLGVIVQADAKPADDLPPKPPRKGRGKPRPLAE